jgi:hypothetical protein
MPIEVSIDLSGSFGATRYQGKRRTCVAFAMSDLNRFHNSCLEWLSVEHLYCSAAALMPNWKPHAGMTVRSGIQVLQGTGQPTESIAPYASDEPLNNPPDIPASGPPHYKYSFQANKPLAKEVIDQLKKGSPVGLLTLLTLEFYYPKDGAIAFTPLAIAESYHAVIACGYGKDPNTSASYIKLRNSWGAGWGVDGHAWVPEAYIDHHAVVAF